MARATSSMPRMRSSVSRPLTGRIASSDASTTESTVASGFIASATAAAIDAAPSCTTPASCM